MSNPITVTVSESNVTAGASVTVTVLNAAPASGAGKTVVSAGGIADLTTEQQAEVSQGVIVLTADGYRYVYSGTGSKTNPASYVVLADITPDWSTLSGKPTSFTPATHAAAHAAAGADPLTVSISQVTGLQTALDGKQPSGSYAPASHGHAVSDVTGLQTALDQKASAAVAWSANHTNADGTEYLIGDLVYSGGNIYRAIATNDSIPVSDASYWALVGAGYRLNIDGRDILNIPDELPASATEGDVLTYSSGVWVAAAPSGGSSLPNGTTAGELLTWDGAQWYAAAPPTELVQGVSSGDVLTWNGSAWTAQAPSGSSLPSGNSQGDVLSWNGSAWAAVMPSTPGLPSGAYLNVIVYDGTNWVAQPLYGGSHSPLANGSMIGDLLAWDGVGNWVPQGAPPASLPLPASSPNTGDVLTYNGTAWDAAAPSSSATLYGRCQMDESQMSVSASTSLSLLPLAGSSTYYIEGLAVIEGQSDAAIGLKLSAGTSDGEVLLDHDYLYDAQNNEWSVSHNLDQTNSTAAYNNGNSWMSTATAPIRFRGWVTTGSIASTTIALHFGSTNGMATITLKAGSWIMATKVA